MPIRKHDVVAVAAILTGVIGALTARRLPEWPGEGRGGRFETHADLPAATSIRIEDIRPSGRGVLSRRGAPDIAAIRGTVIPVDRPDFEATVSVPGYVGQVSMRVEFLNGDEVVGEAQVTALRPTLFVAPDQFGVRGF